MKPFWCMFMSICTIMCAGVAFADISAGVSTANCDASDVGATSTNTRLRADWTPNTIDLTWYNNGNAVSGGPSTCTYDTSITPPTLPARTGYTFGGWRRNPLYSLNTAIDGTKYYFKLDYGGGDLYCYDSDGNADYGCVSSDFNDLAPNEWKVTYSYGTAYGTILGGYITGGDQIYATYDSLDGECSNCNCFCQLNGFKPNGESKINISRDSWVATATTNDNGGDEACLDTCGDYMTNDETFRAVVYNPGYEFLEYIKSSGTQYIDTGYIPNANTRTQIDLQFAGSFHTTATGYFNGFMGVHRYASNFGSESNQYNVIFSWLCRYGTDSNCNANRMDINNNLRTSRQTFILNAKTKATAYGSASKSLSNQTVRQPSGSMILFGQRNTMDNVGVRAFSAYDQMIVYEVSIDENGTLVHHFVPARRRYDNSIGMYDTVTHTFFENAGSGDFVAGPIAQ